MNEGVRFHSGERGAVKIQTILVIAGVLVVAFLAIKITPVYIEQQKVGHDVDELARISALRGYKSEKVASLATKIVGDYGLPENSITFDIKDRHVKIVLGYKRDIDLLVATYSWQVSKEYEHTEMS